MRLFPLFRRVLALALVLLLCASCAACTRFPASGAESAPRDTLSPHIPRMEQRYYLNALRGDDLDNVLALYAALDGLEPSVTLPHPADSEQLRLYLTLLQTSCPELIHVKFSRSLNYTETNGVVCLQLDSVYFMDRAARDEALAACRQEVLALAEACRPQSAEEQEEFVFRALVRRCRYDQSSDAAATAYGALVLGAAKCDGVSLAFQWVLEELGLPCLTIMGKDTALDYGHAWNQVELDGSWYNVDLTPSLHSAGELEQKIPEDLVIFYRFNVSDAFLADELEPYTLLDAVAPRPRCESMDRSYYVLSGQFVFRSGEVKAPLYAQFARMLEDGFSVLQFEDTYDASWVFGDLEKMLDPWLDENLNEKSQWRCAWYLLNKRVLLLVWEPEAEA